MTPARASRCCTGRRRRSSSASASTRSTICPPLGDFVPDASVVEALERGLRMPDDPGAALTAGDHQDDGIADEG